MQVFATGLAGRLIVSFFLVSFITQVVPSYYLTNLKAVAEYRRALRQYFPSERANFVSLEGFYRCHGDGRRIEASQQKVDPRRPGSRN